MSTRLAETTIMSGKIRFPSRKCKVGRYTEAENLSMALSDCGLRVTGAVGFVRRKKRLANHRPLC